MKELIDEMSYDLAECHVDYLDDAKLYTDYDTMAQKMVSRGYRKQSAWISVDDRLPTQRFVIACDEYGNVGEVVRIGESRFEWISNDDRAFVTHWMPLPQPPEMKGGAE